MIVDALGLPIDFEIRPVSIWHEIEADEAFVRGVHLSA
jgi:hypothetical protein